MVCHPLVHLQEGAFHTAPARFPQQFNNSTIQQFGNQQPLPWRQQTADKPPRICCQPVDSSFRSPIIYCHLLPGR